MSLRLDGRVAVVTGAGAGLGRAYAHLLAARGARVIVNDIGGSVRGEDPDSRAADAVVAEIRDAGGEAAANYDSVSDRAAARRIVDSALDHFGKIDILVNNAGILRDRSFIKVDLDDFLQVLEVHLLGSVYCTHAAWEHMTAQKYGRVVMTTSVAGLNGNFGQAAYGSAKMGVLGLMNTLAIEGRKNGILVNAISPAAYTRMTQSIIPEDIGKFQGPEQVAPAVGWMCSEACTETGMIIAASAGGFSRVKVFENEIVQLDPTQPISVEAFAEAYPRISDLSSARPTEPGFLGDADVRLKALSLV